MNDLRESLGLLEAQSKNDFRRQALVKMLLPITEGQRVLDVGCGMGFATEFLVSMGKIAVALDTENSYITYTVERTKSYFQPASGVNYGGETLPFANGVFDTVLAFDVIEHVERDDFFVQELWRVLANKGLLIVVVPALQFLYGKRDKALGHYRRYNKQVLKRILKESGFKINQIKYWNALGILPYAFSELLLHREISDKIRTGEQSHFHRILAKILSKWLIFENKLYLPIGLSLIAVSRKVVDHSIRTKK